MKSIETVKDLIEELNLYNCNLPISIISEIHDTHLDIKEIIIGDCEEESTKYKELLIVVD